MFPPRALASGCPSSLLEPVRIFCANVLYAFFCIRVACLLFTVVHDPVTDSRIACSVMDFFVWTSLVSINRSMQLGSWMQLREVSVSYHLEGGMCMCVLLDVPSQPIAPPD